MDLNKLAEKLKAQRNVGVNRNGSLTSADPRNDGSEASVKDGTTLEPRRFFAS